MLRQEQKEINGHTYTVTQFTASEGFPLMINIRSIENGIENIDQILKLFAKTTRDNEAINHNNFDRFFTDNYGAIQELIEFIITFNFLPKKGTGNLTEKPALKLTRQKAPDIRLGS